ncbi:hypothetical protein [Acinetobacter modestus]|uniref:hypothetical protein n=1 Tax=Acinetobacter modestus TaxID=1776740 RepID=UPI00301638CD
MPENNTQGMKESDVCNAFGVILIGIGIIAGFLFILFFGRIEVASYYSTTKIWSGLMVSTGIGIMFNGFIIGYLFQKIASILRYHEDKV